MAGNNTGWPRIRDWLLRKEEAWCDALGIFNPYMDPFESHLRGDVPVYDGQAYDLYPDHRFVYDKLGVATTQGLAGGVLGSGAEQAGLPYPVFVKPRWGHKTSGSKHCTRVDAASELPSQAARKEHELIWTALAEGKEGMTDFVLVSGRIVYQMTHEYSEEAHAFAEVWKYTAPDNAPPVAVSKWVRTHMSDFTGIVNVQYRGQTIIEVGLRPARTGAYLAATDNADLLDAISTALSEGTWPLKDARSLRYKPFYSFKCHTTAPIVYLWPQHALDVLMCTLSDRPFYEYYPEPTGRNGMVFFQFMHDDLADGRAAATCIEWLFWITQWCVIAMWLCVLALVFVGWRWRWVALALACALFGTQLLNPFSVPLRFGKAGAAQRAT